MRVLLVFCFLVSATCFAQPNKTWGAFVNAIPAKPFAGKKFKIEAAIKVSLMDNDADAELWVRVDKADKKVGFFYNMMDSPIRSSEWKVYSISGTIDETADWLVFGGLYHKRGIFYFDDFKFFVENTAGIMEQQPLVNGDFEADTLFTKHSWGYNKELNVYNISLTTNEFYNGKQCCKVDGTALRSSGQYGDNDSTGKYATVNGVRIYYEEYGKGEPLLLLHGNSVSINSFRLQIPELSNYFHVYAIDTRGHGKSGDDNKTYTYDLFAADMNALLDSLHLDSVNILGWSDGGNTGLIMAMRYPEKVKKLVTMGAVLFIDNSVADKWVFNTLNKEKKSFAVDRSAYAAGRLRRIELLLTEPRHKFEELKTVSCPVLVIAGEKDVVKKEHTEGIAAAIPNAELMIVPKATHELPWEDAPFFNEAVIKFLKK